MITSVIDLQLDYEVYHAAHFFLHIESALHPAHEIVQERLTITPAVRVRHSSDERLGNRFVRLDAHPGLLQINYHAVATLQHLPVPAQLGECPVSDVPDDVLRYLMPSRYCESDILSQDAQRLFGHLPHGLSRVKAVESWIHDTIAYQPGSSISTTTAHEIFTKKAGVCRDFAHLGITLCRALNIPARLVVGYVYFDEPPQDFHAVFEAWLDGQWVLFDATRMAPNNRLVRVGTGRDAKDVAFATLFGDVRMVRKEITVTETDSEAATGADNKNQPEPLLGAPLASGTATTGLAASLSGLPTPV